MFSTSVVFSALRDIMHISGNVQYINGVLYIEGLSTWIHQGCSVYRGISWIHQAMFSTSTVFTTLRDIMNTSGNVQYIKGVSTWLSVRNNFKVGALFKNGGGAAPMQKGGKFSLGGQILKVVDTIHWAVLGSRTLPCVLTTFAINYATALWCDSSWLCCY